MVGIKAFILQLQSLKRSLCGGLVFSQIQTGSIHNYWVMKEKFWAMKEKVWATPERLDLQKSSILLNPQRLWTFFAPGVVWLLTWSSLRSYSQVIQVLAY